MDAIVNPAKMAINGESSPDMSFPFRLQDNGLKCDEDGLFR